MTSTVRELAALVGGSVHGDGDLSIVAARPLNEAASGHITFVDSEKHLRRLHDSPASAAVVTLDVSPNGKALIRVADPFAAFVSIARHLHGSPEPPPHGVDPLAHVHPTAVIGAAASVFPFAVIGAGCVIGDRCHIHSGAVIGQNCRLGEHVTLHPHAVLYDDTVVGNRVTVHAGAILGADGFGYRLINGRHAKIPQLGTVEIGDDVEIGAGTTIDRGTFGTTRIGNGTKIDNLVMIGHNCQVGRHNIIVGQAGLAGSSSTGDYVVIAGQVGVVDHVHIGDRCVIGGQAGVTKDVPAGEHMLGSPATPLREQKKMMMSMAVLPEIRKRLRAIEQQLGVNNSTAETL